MSQERCLFPEKEKIINMKDRVREKVYDCDPISVKMLDNTTSFLEDMFHTNKKMCYTDYSVLRHQLTTLATKFSENCSCVKKKNF